MAAPSSFAILRRAFVDICRGYSVGTYQGKSIYIKHLSHYSHLDLDDLQAHYEETARKLGGSTEAERLAVLKQRGEWSDRHEADIERQKDAIFRFEDGKRSHSAPSILEQYDRQIAQEKKKLEDMLMRRAELIGYTVETYAQNRLNDHYIVSNLFADKALTTPLFSIEILQDDSGEGEVEEIMRMYSATVEPCNDLNLRKLAVQDFFTSYYSLCNDNLQSFYGRPICDLTYYQVRLGNIARYFKHILEHTDLSKVAPTVRGDPDAIERLYTAQKNTAQATSEGKLPSGLTNKDIKELGLEGQYTKLPNKELSGQELIQYLRSQHKSA